MTTEINPFDGVALLNHFDTTAYAKYNPLIWNQRRKNWNWNGVHRIQQNKMHAVQFILQRICYCTFNWLKYMSVYNKIDFISPPAYRITHFYNPLNAYKTTNYFPLFWLHWRIHYKLLMVNVNVLCSCYHFDTFNEYEFQKIKFKIIKWNKLKSSNNQKKKNKIYFNCHFIKCFTLNYVAERISLIVK